MREVATANAGHSAPSLPTATRAATSQVGIRARERNIPIKSPSHASDGAVARGLDLTHLPLRGQRRTGLNRGYTGFPFHPLAAWPRDS